jgi:hypothetical protein
MESPRLILQLTRAFIRDSRMRRAMMFWTTLASLITLFLGATVLSGLLAARPLLFIAWWAICAWMMLAATLLAIFDLLMIRAAARQAKRDLSRKVLVEKDDEDTH